mmetsp:Transcript_28477/g.84317  ORF Transcript_28477/g.84317 Transcript_28477/m.84317 type:complete len:223 (+) Transcript_28477:828-1496(+)
MSVSHSYCMEFVYVCVCVCVRVCGSTSQAHHPPPSSPLPPPPVSSPPLLIAWDVSVSSRPSPPTTPAAPKPKPLLDPAPPIGSAPPSICFSKRNSFAASLMREKLMQKACSSCSRSAAASTRLRMRLCRNTHTRRTSRLCTNLSCVPSHEPMQLEMYRWTNSGGSSTEAASRLTTSMPCSDISDRASTSMSSSTRPLGRGRSSVSSSADATAGECSTSEGRC